MRSWTMDIPTASPGFRLSPSSYVSDPLPQSCVGSSSNWTALTLDAEGLSRVPCNEQAPLMLVLPPPKKETAANRAPVCPPPPFLTPFGQGTAGPGDSRCPDVSIWDVLQCQGRCGLKCAVRVWPVANDGQLALLMGVFCCSPARY